MKRLRFAMVFLLGFFGAAGAVSTSAKAENLNPSDYIWSLNFSCGAAGKNGYFKFKEGQKIIDGKLEFNFKNGVKLELEHEVSGKNSGEFEGLLIFPSGDQDKYWMKYTVVGEKITGWGTLNGNSYNPCDFKGVRKKGFSVVERNRKREEIEHNVSFVGAKKFEGKSDGEICSEAMSFAPNSVLHPGYETSGCNAFHAARSCGFI